MKSYYKIVLLIIISLCYNLNAQENKSISLKVSGIGKTPQEAKTNALKTAFEQSIRTFVSTNKEIQTNNELAEQYILESNGVPNSFEILNESKLLDGNWGCILKSDISINKLTNFAIKKGIPIEIKDGIFKLKIDQQLLNDENEIRSIVIFSKFVLEYFQKSFNYEVSAGEPNSISDNNQKWNLPIKVITKSNTNYSSLNNYCMSVLQQISLSKDEIANYSLLKKTTYSIIIKNNILEKKFFFRKKISADLLNYIFNLQNDYIKNFIIHIGKSNIKAPRDNYEDSNEIIRLYNNGDVVKKFNIEYTTSLDEIKQLSVPTIEYNKYNYIFQFPNITKNYTDLTYEEITSKVNNSYNNIDDGDISIHNADGLDVQPGFPGGSNAWLDFLIKKFEMPDEPGLNGKVIMSFVVEKDGSLTDIKILKDIGYGAGKAAERALRLSPKWTPAEQNGRKVRCAFQQAFKIQTPEQ